MGASPMYRLLALACLVFLAAGPVRAESNPTTPTTPVATGPFKFEILTPGGTYLNSDVERGLYFNRAHCQCKSGVTIRVSLNPGQAMPDLPTKPATLRIGESACVTATTSNFHAAKCADVGTVMLSDLIRPHDFTITVHDLFQAPNLKDNNPECGAESPQNIFLMIDADGNGLPDMNYADAMAPTVQVQLDGKAPPAPTDVKVTPGNGALSLSWTKTSLISDQNGFVVFCSRAGLPVFKDTFFKTNDFFTQDLVCGSGTSAMTQRLTALEPVGAADAVPVDETATGRPIDPPPEMQRLDTAFVCSNLLTTSNESRISILQNGIPYVVGVAAVDKHGNASPLEKAYVQTPVATTDFYTAYRQSGGAAQGGFCSYGQRGRAAGWCLSLLALAAVAMTRRRR
jgi:hypothetical protein